MGGIASILVVDDEEKILEIVKSYLEKSGYRVLTAKTGAQALALLKNNPISLLLLDLMLPDLPGEDICMQVRKTSDIPIIMMTAKVDEESIIHGLQIGADDYITKPFSPRQLVARVAAMLRRMDGTNANKHILQYNALCMDSDTHTVLKAGQNISLTPNEYKILLLLLSRPHKVFTRDEIILNTQAEEYEVFDRSIDSHIKNLRQKIEDDPKNPSYIVTVYGVGYKIGNDRP